MERQMSLASSCTDDIKTEAEGIYHGCDLTSTDIQKKNGISDNLEDLLALYTNKPEKRRVGEKKGHFKCDTCDNPFVYKSSLKKHVKSVHEGLIYSCDQCEFIAKEQGTL